MGHSFGEATAVQMVRLADQFPWVGPGILLEVWGPATPTVENGPSNLIRTPLLSVSCGFRARAAGLRAAQARPRRGAWPWHALLDASNLRLNAHVSEILPSSTHVPCPSS